MNEIRPLTRREQLEWLVPFLYEQKRELEEEIEKAEMELKKERKKDE